MPSENADATTSGDRRTRKREARRDHLLDLAADLVEQHGIEGVTMAALAESADYAPASLYTYFPSRSALLAALQQRALVTLAAVARDRLAGWDRALEVRDATQSDATPSSATRRVHALTRLWAFSDLFLAAPVEQPREFKLQQLLLVTPGAEDTADAATVVPTAMSVLEVPRRLLVDASGCGALVPHRELTDPLGEPLDGDVLRTFAWTVALNGALMVDTLSTGLPSTGAALGTEITASLLSGWGARPTELADARELASRITDTNGSTP